MPSPEAAGLRPLSFPMRSQIRTQSRCLTGYRTEVAYQALGMQLQGVATPPTGCMRGSRAGSALARTAATASSRSRSLAMNKAWFTAALIAWLRHIALDGDLARAEPKTLRYLRLSGACP